MDPDPLNRLRPIVLIDPDHDGREWLKQQLASTGRPVREFADALKARSELHVEEVGAFLIAIGQDSGDDSSIHTIREVACWIRNSRSRPGLFAFARRALSPNALVAALHRGANSVITVDQMVIFRELVEAQLRARAAWEEPVLAAGAEASSPRDGWGASIEVRPGDHGGEGPEGGSKMDARESAPPVREVTLMPRTALQELPVQEPGWIPRPVDFQITDDDPIDLKHYESKAVLRAIAAADGNRTLAAQLLGIGKSTLYRRLSEWRASLS